MPWASAKARTSATPRSGGRADSDEDMASRPGMPADRAGATDPRAHGRSRPGRDIPLHERRRRWGRATPPRRDGPKARLECRALPSADSRGRLIAVATAINSQASGPRTDACQGVRSACIHWRRWAPRLRFAKTTFAGRENSPRIDDLWGRKNKRKRVRRELCRVSFLLFFSSGLQLVGAAREKKRGQPPHALTPRLPDARPCALPGQ